MILMWILISEAINHNRSWCVCDLWNINNVTTVVDIFIIAIALIIVIAMAINAIIFD